MQVRRFVPDERDAVLAFLRDLEAEGRSGLSEAKHVRLTTPAAPGEGMAASRGGQIVGYAGLAPAATGEWAIEVVSADQDAIAALVKAGLDRAVELGAARLRWWTYDRHLESAPPDFGFSPERTLLRMERPLPHPETPRFPVGVEVRGFRPGVDDGAWLEVNNAAFSGHPENSDLDEEELSRRLAYDWFEAEGLRMAWEGDELVGFCWTKVHPDRSGEIYIIGVAPGHQGRGLGRALALEGLRHLTTRGCPRVLLYTEGENEAAVGLYESLGFEVVDVHRSFIRDVA